MGIKGWLAVGGGILAVGGAILGIRKRGSKEADKIEAMIGDVDLKKKPVESVDVETEDVEQAIRDMEIEED